MTGRAVLVVCLTLALAGCAGDAGSLGEPVARLSGALGKDIVAIRDMETADVVDRQVVDLLRKPLNADKAVQIALYRNKGLQAAFNELGIREAQLLQFSLPPGPTLSLSRLASSGSFEVERAIVGNVLGLLTTPARAEIATIKRQSAREAAAEAVLRLAFETRRAYWRAVASAETVTFLEQSREAARTISELFRKLGETGAVNRQDQAREHVFYAETTAQLGAARLTAAADREALVRQVGLWGGDLRFTLPSRLPALTGKPRNLPLVEQEAIRNRVDLAMMRADVEAAARQNGLTQATRFINVLSLKGTAKTDTGAQTVESGGVELELNVPLWDGGEGRTREAQESYLRLVNLLAERAINVRSQAREAYLRYRGTHELARHWQTQVLPLRDIISEEALLRYNAMIIDVVPLIADARARIAARITAIDARRDVLLAEINLQAAIMGGMTGTQTKTAVMTATAATEGH